MLAHQVVHCSKCPLALLEVQERCLNRPIVSKFFNHKYLNFHAIYLDIDFGRKNSISFSLFLILRTFVYAYFYMCSFVHSLAPLYHPDTLVNLDTYIVFLFSLVLYLFSIFLINFGVDRLAVQFSI